jgi:CMP-N,N'-diacetyllegionaminic acid synthase
MDTTRGKVLAVITARGGSKGLPGKNILPLAGRPLLAWTIAAANAAKGLDRLILSTDDEEIAEAARALGCEVPFIRPPELASDTATSVDVVLHACAQLPEYDTVCLLQPTSPFRRSDDIDSCLEMFWSAAADSVISFTTLSKPAQWLFRKDAGEHISPLLPGPINMRRQDCETLYVPNGAVYVIAVATLQRERTFYLPKTKAYVMPQERSLDIDTRLDFKLAEVLADDSLGR